MLKTAMKVFGAMTFGLGILFLLFRNTDLTPFISRLRELDWRFACLVALGFAGVFFFRTLRLAMAFGDDKFVLFQIVVIHNFINRLLPLRLGEFSLPYLTRRYLKVNFLDGLGMLLLIRVVDVCVIFLLAAIAISACRPPAINVAGVAFLWLLTSLLLFMLFRLRYLLSFCVSVLARAKGRKLGELRDKLAVAAAILSIKSKILFMPRLMVYSLGNWLATYLIYYGFIRAVGFDYSYWLVALSASVVTIVGNLLVNNVAQLGSFELGWVIGFVCLADMPRDIAAPLGLFVNIACMIIVTAAAMFAYAALCLSRNSAEGVTHVA